LSAHPDQGERDDSWTAMGSPCGMVGGRDEATVFPLDVDVIASGYDGRPCPLSNQVNSRI